MDAPVVSPQASIERRRAAWSDGLTRPVGRVTPAYLRPALLSLIRGLHTLIFLSVAAMIGLVAWDGLRGQPGRRTALALGVVLAESVAYASNNQVCPLTPLAEELGAESGSVVDIYLPAAVARRIPSVSVAVVLLGLALNLRALLRRRERLAAG